MEDTGATVDLWRAVGRHLMLGPGWWYLIGDLANTLEASPSSTRHWPPAGGSRRRAAAPVGHRVQLTQTCHLTSKWKSLCCMACDRTTGTEPSQTVAAVGVLHCATRTATLRYVIATEPQSLLLYAEQLVCGRLTGARAAAHRQVSPDATAGGPEWCDLRDPNASRFASGGNA